APEPVAAVEEMPLAAFDEPVSAEPELTAASDDPFGDISFEEEVPAAEPEPVAAEPEPVAAADDWSDVAAEPAVAEPVAVAPAVEEPVVEDVFAAEPVEEIAEDFSFVEEEPAAVSPPAEEAPVAEVDLDVFDMDEDEIMPLGDDDILGEEDLEPAMPEQTLAAWSRDDSGDDVFAETHEEAPAIESEAAFVAPVAEPAFVEENFAVAANEPVAEPLPVEESVAAFEVPVPAVEEPVPAIEEPEPAAVAATMADVEAKASALGEEELEQIIEKVVTKVVEKLAGSILERVAWDIVPDLAENLIREEIRKIKDAAA
ncbi:MAG: hypothetical protein KAU27_03470, partial [Desulfuromonadales bacterium]|nr:hypothetical protein [Desulfuromonadales bacterium]